MSYADLESARKIAERLVRLKYEENLARVILDDWNLPAYKECREAAEEILAELGIPVLRDKLADLESQVMAYNDEVYHLQKSVEEADEQMRAMARAFKKREQIRQDGPLTFRDAELLRDTDPDRWIEEEDDWYE